MVDEKTEAENEWMKCLVAGEIALPGGKAEEGDKDDGDTATREAKEEIGLDPSLVNVVTVLEPFLSKVPFLPNYCVFIFLFFFVVEFSFIGGSLKAGTFCAFVIVLLVTVEMWS